MNKIISICMICVVNILCVGCSLGGTAAGYVDIKNPGNGEVNNPVEREIQDRIK